MTRQAITPTSEPNTALAAALASVTVVVETPQYVWAWNTSTAHGPVCQVQEQIDGKTVFVPRPCSDILNKENK